MVLRILDNVDKKKCYQNIKKGTYEVGLIG